MTTAVSRRRWLILVVETKARELHAKLLLGLLAADRGWGVIIGNKNALRAAQTQLPRGTFIEKGVPPGRTSNVERARSAGNRASAMCEEGLLYLSPEDYLHRRLHRPSFDALDFFFTWGSRQTTDLLEVMEHGQEKIVTSGNPRLDLLRDEWRGVFERAAQDLRNRHGRIILVNTKFALVNNIDAEIRDYTDHLKAAGKISSEAHEALWRRYSAVQERVYPLFLELLPALSKAFKDHTVVVRPHPSERDTPWMKKARDLPNVQVAYDGNVHEWIMAADVVIQNNCTTGVEAFLLGKPTISYRPCKDDGVELELPDRVSLGASTEGELIDLIRRIIGNDIDPAAIHSAERDYVKQYIANVDGKSACETILDTMDGLDLPISDAVFPIGPVGIAKSMSATLKRRLPAFKSLLAYNSKKFPGLELAEMNQLVDDFREVSGKFADIRIAQAMDDGFCVYKP
jgi:surface carbohydrate biosynthesis protein